MAAPAMTVDGVTLKDALAAVFAANPALRSYVVDDQGALRRHVQVFVDGGLARDRMGLSDPLGPDSEIYVFQALSGG